MARPRSDEKRNAIIAAAIQMIGEQGMSAPTSAIAKRAGVAEGTLFKYFATKDELVNAAYLVVKGEMQSVTVAHDQKKLSVRERTRQFWNFYVEWGAAHPDKRRAMTQFTMSDRLTDESKASGNLPFADFNASLKKVVQTGVLSEQPTEFALAILRSLAETTMDFMIQDPARATAYRDSSFEAFWKAIAK